MGSTFFNTTKKLILDSFAPTELKRLKNVQTTIPKLAKNSKLLAKIDSILPSLPTHHQFHCADATKIQFLKPESVHLVLTSPPYWTLKKYNDRDGQLGDIERPQSGLGGRI